MVRDENASLVRTGVSLRLVVSKLEFVHRTNLKENGERYGILIMRVIVVVENYSRVSNKPHFTSSVYSY